MVKIVEIRIHQDQGLALGPFDQFRQVEPQPDAQGNGKVRLGITEGLFKPQAGLGGTSQQPFGKVTFLPIQVFGIQLNSFEPSRPLPKPVQPFVRVGAGTDTPIEQARRP